MSLAAFMETPWRVSHKGYEDSFLNIRPAPEFSTAEVAIASLYRAIGFPGVTENQIPKAGRELDKESARLVAIPMPGQLSAHGWRTVLHGVLDSPKQPKQSSKRFLQLTPIVPDASLYSGSARLAGNSWNPGLLVQRIVQLGSLTSPEAARVWAAVFDGLSVDREDDVWARWLQEQFETRRPANVEWRLREMEPFVNDLPESDKAVLEFPAKQFVKDLSAVLSSKPWMTRRQWVSLLESIVRLGMVSHVMWLAVCGARTWRCARSLLTGTPLPHDIQESDARQWIMAPERQLMSYGNLAMPAFRDIASAYLESRLGINLVLWALDETGHRVSPLSSAANVSDFLKTVAVRREHLNNAGVMQHFESLQASEARAIACKSGIGSNIIEFCRHTLGQRQTATETLRGYDQGYFLRKRSDSPNSPWILALGPVAALTVVHCCLSETSGPRSIQRLSDHLSSYGLEIDLDDISSGDLGRKLRMLGLVLDSPDAESGMLLVPPFAGSAIGGQS